MGQQYKNLENSSLLCISTPLSSFR